MILKYISKSFLPAQREPLHFSKKGFLLQICSMFTEEYPCKSVISIHYFAALLKSHSDISVLPERFMHIFRKTFYRNTYGGMLLKIISINRKIETHLQQPVTLTLSSTILAFAGQSDFQFSMFCNINRALESNIPGSEYAAMIKINRNKFYLMLYSHYDVQPPITLALSHFVLFCILVVLCCLVLSRVVSYCVVFLLEQFCRLDRYKRIQ